jgi:O-antigen/teichoic acid export membrane protein
VAQAIFGLAMAASAVLASAGAYALGSSLAPLFLAMAPALFVWQLQEFVRQVQYTQGRTSAAFAYDVVAYGGQLAVVLGLLLVGELTAPAALCVIAACMGASAGLGLMRLGLHFESIDVRVLRANWRFGRWLLADGLGQWLSSQLLPLLTAGFAGAAATGVLKAIQNLIAPAHVLMNAYIAFALPRASRAFVAGGRAALLAFLLPISLLTTALLVVYWLAISLLGGQLLSFAYGSEFSGYGALVGLMSLAYLFHFVCQAESVALLAMENGRAIFAGRVVAVVLTFTAGVWLIWRFEVYGAVAASVVAGLAMNTVLAVFLWRAGREPAQEARALSFAHAGGES